MDVTPDALLAVKDLSIAFSAGTRTTLAVDRISFNIKKGETVALVGESGSGKSATALSIMKLLPYPAASHPSGQVLFKGQDLLGLSERNIREIRDADITIIFQEPMTSLNPLHTIEQQLAEILLLHRGMTGAPARARLLELLNQVGIPNPGTRSHGISAATPKPETPTQDLPAQDARRRPQGRVHPGAPRQRAGPVDRRRADDRARR